MTGVDGLDSRGAEYGYILLSFFTYFCFLYFSFFFLVYKLNCLVERGPGGGEVRSAVSWK